MAVGHGSDVILSNTLTVNGISSFTTLTVNTLTQTGNVFSLGSANVIANNGYSRLPNGLLLQWGNALCNSIAGNITFHIPFSTVYQGLVSGNSVAVNTIPVVSSINTTVIVLRSANTGTGISASWIALGV